MAKERVVYEDRECEWCQTIFTPNREWAKFCSDRCRNANHRDKYAMDKGHRDETIRNSTEALITTDDDYADL